MTPEDVQFLVADAGRAWLEKVDLTAHDHLWWATHLRRSLPPHQVNAILETALLRQKGQNKFKHGREMLFTRDALEQASHEAVSKYRAEKFHKAGIARIADLGCGIGGDAIPLAQHADVIGVDLSRVRLLMARENSRVHAVADRMAWVEADLMNLPPIGSVSGLFFDPARRDEFGKRIFSVEAYRPPLSLVDRWRAKTPATAVKISPGVSYQELPSEQVAEAEFISYRGDLKSCVLWYGPLHSGVARRATLLPSGESLTSDREDQLDIPVREPARFLFEPDAAVIRSHLVQTLAAQLGASRIDTDIAYLTSDQPVKTEFARCFEIDVWMPFSMKRIKQALRERQIGRVTVKKRGSALDPDQLSRQLRGKGRLEGILFLTQHKNRPIAGIGRELSL